MSTLKNILDNHFPGMTHRAALDALYDLLNDIDMVDGFRGGVWGPDDIIDNIAHACPL